MFGGLLLVACACATPAQETPLPGPDCANSSCHTERLDASDPHSHSVDSSDCLDCHVVVDVEQHSFEHYDDTTDHCTGCHGAVGTENLHQHAPVTTGVCAYCHNTHKSENEALLKFPTNTLCIGCHVRLVPEEEHVVHGPVVDRDCTACHETHGSEVEGLLTKPAPELCFDCHNDDLEDHQGKPLPAVGPTFVDKSLNQHPPFARGKCLMCHDPHSSSNHRLQRWPYQDAFYTGFSSTAIFCLMCHGETAFSEPRTLEATKFRNGNLNLHYRHVNRDKSRGCRACHHQHASRNDAQIATDTFMGSENIGIREYAKTESGGSCSPTCHRSVRYDRLEVVDNQFVVTAREGVDATVKELTGAPLTHSGSTLYQQRCAGCHGADANGRIGPRIGGATIDRVADAVDRVDLMGDLADVDPAVLQMIVDAIPSGIDADLPGEADGAGEGLAAFTANCAGCHGTEGGGRVGPAITGASMEKVTNAIATVPMMIAMQHLDAATISLIAHHLQELAVMEEAEHLARDGESLFIKKCSSCHGMTAEGSIGPKIQGATVVLALDAITHVPMMGEVNTLSHEEIEAITAFLATLVDTNEQQPEAGATAETIDGQAIFSNTCALCHAQDAGGQIGSDIRGLGSEAIFTAIRDIDLMHQLRVLTPEEIGAVGSYLQQIPRGKPTPREGRRVFKANCEACHGTDAKGLVGPDISQLAAPDITAAIARVPMMIGMKGLDERDIEAVAVFLADARQRTGDE